MAEARAASAPDAQSTMKTEDTQMADATTRRLRERQLEHMVRQIPSASVACTPKHQSCASQPQPASLPLAAGGGHRTRPGGRETHYIRWRRRPALSNINRTNNGASQQPDASKCGTGTETADLLLSSLQNQASTFGKTWHTEIRASDAVEPTTDQQTARPRLIGTPAPTRSPLCQADPNATAPLTPAIPHQPHSIPALLTPNSHINYAPTFNSTLGFPGEGPPKAKIVTYNINGAKNQEQLNRRAGASQQRTSRCSPAARDTFLHKRRKIQFIKQAKSQGWTAHVSHGSKSDTCGKQRSQAWANLTFIDSCMARKQDASPDAPHRSTQGLTGCTHTATTLHGDGTK
jgi:hypothetical protein